MIRNVELKTPTYVLFQFDGTQASVDELAEQWSEATGEVPVLTYIGQTSYRVQSGMGNLYGDLDTICVFEFSLSGDVRLAGDYPNQAAADLYWATA